MGNMAFLEQLGKIHQKDIAAGKTQYHKLRPCPLVKVFWPVQCKVFSEVW